MKVRTFFVGACLTAAALPAFLMSYAAQPVTPARPGPAAVASPVTWPTHFRGRPLTQLPLTPLEARFAARFPGAVARFAFDGAEGRQVLIARHVTQATRQLHPAVDCFRAAGYAVGQDTPKIDADGARWRCFIATRDHKHVRVCERIVPAAAADAGEWTDVSAWYWHALWHGGGPWRALTLVTPL